MCDVMPSQRGRREVFRGFCVVFPDGPCARTVVNPMTSLIIDIDFKKITVYGSETTNTAGTRFGRVRVEYDPPAE